MQSRAPLSDSFPLGMQSAARDLTTFATPLILARVLRVAAGIVRPEKKMGGIRRSISESGVPQKPILLTGQISWSRQSNAPASGRPILLTGQISWSRQSNAPASGRQ